MPPAPTRRRDVERERARARGARRLLPWSIATAVGGALIAVVAGGGLRAGAALAALGLLFTLFLWTTSIARCPACGAPLPRRWPDGKRPDPHRGAGPADVEASESCPRCRARFE
jgi:hypothetical protein